MMLRDLVDEVMRRRLWPILLGAVVVAVAAPLLFLKSGPAEGVSTAAPAAAPAGELPARAQRLLTKSEAPGSIARRPGGKATDPFQAPASHRGAAAAAAKGRSPATSETTKAAAVAEPVPVVVTNADGTKPAAGSPATVTTGRPATTAPPKSKSGAKRPATVDVRFGRRHPGRIHRSIPRRQTFVAGGRVIAIFVKYSPNRDKAVFAIAPRTLVTGDLECRRKQNLCRYVDIPAGKHVRLTTLTAAGNLVSRRLDVVRIDRTRSTGGSATAARSAPADGGCLLRKLLALGAKDAPLAGDACKG